MRNRISLLIALVLGSLSIGSLALGGPRDTGGGHLVLLPDGRMVLADQFAAEITMTDPILAEAIVIDGYLYTLEENLRKEIDLLLDPIRRLATEVSKFKDREINSPEVRFALVRALPDLPECKELAYLPKLPQSAQAQGSVQVACTVGKNTWILEDLFQRLSLRERAKVILHERLRNWRAPQPLSYVAAITGGVALLRELIEAQREGLRLDLTAEELQVVQNLLIALQKAELTVLPLKGNVKIARRGGGIYTRDMKLDVDADSILGAGSFIYSTYLNGTSVLRMRGAQILNSAIHWPLGIHVTLGAGARIYDSDIVVGKIALDEGALIYKSALHYPYEPYLNGEVITLARKSSIEETALSFREGYASEVSTLTLGEDSHLLNVARSLVFGEGQTRGFFTKRLGQPELVLEKGATLDLKGTPLSSACGNVERNVRVFGLQRVARLEDFRSANRYICQEP